MDLSTIIGLAVAGAIIVAVMIMDGGSPAELFAHPSAILLTVGGALAAAMVSYPLKITTSLPKILLKAIKGGNFDPMPAIETIVSMADKARREGLLALEDEVKNVDDAFLRKGLMLVVDGTDPSLVRAILESDIHNMRERHGQGAGFFSTAGGYAPTMGIIGTVMGLITVLQQLDEPSKLGKAIAGAFLATLWGIMSANVFWLPIGAKLYSKSEAEASYRKLLLEGILSVQAGENPRMVREKLSSFLPPAKREEEMKQISPHEVGVEA